MERDHKSGQAESARSQERSLDRARQSSQEPGDADEVADGAEEDTRWADNGHYKQGLQRKKARQGHASSADRWVISSRTAHDDWQEGDKQQLSKEERERTTGEQPYP